MFYFYIDIDNPFVEDFRNTIIFDKAISITKNKSFEIQINGFDPKSIFNFEFSIRTKQSHSGLKHTLTFFGIGYIIGFVDNRHWDDENERYMSYDEMSKG